MLNFSTWETEIATVSSLPDFQNATIRIVNPSALTTTYDYATNDYTVTGDGLVYEGQARVKPINASRNFDQAYVEDPTTAKNVRVQIPSSALPETPIRRGFQVQVVDGAFGKVLEQYLLTVTSDVPSSNMASRTFDTVVNVEVNPEWTA